MKLVRANSLALFLLRYRLRRIGLGLWRSLLKWMSHARNSLGGWQDTNGHGTHVSGIIAARGGRNIEGVYDARGVAPAAIVNMVSGVGGTGGNYTYSDAFTYGPAGAGWMPLGGDWDGL